MAVLIPMRLRGVNSSVVGWRRSPRALGKPRELVGGVLAVRKLLGVRVWGQAPGPRGRNKRGRSACWQTLSLPKGRPTPGGTANWNQFSGRVASAGDGSVVCVTRLAFGSRGKPTLPRGRAVRGRSACRPIPGGTANWTQFSGSDASVGNGSVVCETGWTFASGGKPPDHTAENACFQNRSAQTAARSVARFW